MNHAKNLSGVQKMRSKFNAIADETDSKLKKNPFSDTYEEQRYDTQAADYGRPTKGSLTEKRGIRAGAYILNEVIHLCEIIVKHGEGPDESRAIKFGPLFKIYEFYSDKVVGLLIRARKYGLLDFEGEMLYQRQDDHKWIIMLMSMEDIYTNVKYSGDPKNIIHVDKPAAPTASQEVTPTKTQPEKEEKESAKSERVQKARAKLVKKTEPPQQPRSAYYTFCI